MATKSLDYGKFNQTDMGRLLVSNGKTFKLDDILEYDTILSNYPDIKESVVSFTRLNDGEPYHFYYDQELMKYVFEVDAEQLDTSMLSDILVKGTNFAVQHKEGFDYSLTEKQRKNFMDRHVFMAKKEFVDDFKDDLKTGSFNVIKNAFGNELTDEAKQILKTAMTLELEKMSKGIELFDFSSSCDVERIVKNITYIGLPKEIERVILGKEKKKAF